MYSVAGAIGFAGALRDYGKPLTMLVAISAVLVVEGVNYLIHRRSGQDT